MKYLSYFLNCVAKVSYLWTSEEFQLFLNSNSSDLKRLFEKMQKPTFESIVLRYQNTFSQVKPDPALKNDLIARINDTAIPFYNQLRETENALILAKKDLYRLAVRREDYLKSMGDLYSDALPEFEKYIASSCEEATTVLLSNELSRKKISEANTSKADSYWIVYEALRLEIRESRAAVEIIHNRQLVEREQERIAKKIATNEQELANIKDNKLSLKQFFNTNTEQLVRELQEETDFLRREQGAVELTIVYMYELILGHLVVDFKQKRCRLWGRAFGQLVAHERELGLILQSFFQLIA